MAAGMSGSWGQRDPRAVEHHVDRLGTAAYFGLASADVRERLDALIGPKR